MTDFDDRVSDGRKARLAHYERIRQGALEQFRITEENLRKLEGLEPERIEAMVADVHKRHEKLLNRIDRHLAAEKARS